jgi:mannose-6-phosphate isomerase
MLKTTFMPASFNTPPIFRLLPEFKQRIWGIDDLSGWFSDAGSDRIGEVWFTAGDNKTSLGPALADVLRESPHWLGTGCDSNHPGLCPLLIKLLFTSSRLSVQVHPKDDYAQQHHQSLGKTEAWFVIKADPGAKVALGFKEAISPERFRDSARSGEIETLLDWRPVRAGDTIFVPAGTVHAIGAGLTICEVQQNSDITYRLYDYGRPRELHLEHGSAVSDLGPYLHHSDRRELDAGRALLVESQYFRMEHLHQRNNRFTIPGGLRHYCLLTSLSGSGTIAGERFVKGQVWMIPAGAGPVDLVSDDAEWLLSYTGAEPPIGIQIR